MRDENLIGICVILTALGFFCVGVTLGWSGALQRVSTGGIELACKPPAAMLSRACDRKDTTNDK